MIRPVFDKIAIIGAGLIGSSIALAARDNGAAGKVALFDASEDVRERATRLGLGSVCNMAAEACEGADCIILCVPVGAIGEACETIAPHLKPGAILSDVGSVKEKALAAMQADKRVDQGEAEPGAGFGAVAALERPRHALQTDCADQPLPYGTPRRHEQGRGRRVEAVTAMAQLNGIPVTLAPVTPCQ